MLEAAWRIPKWAMMKDALTQVEISCPKDLVWKVNLYRGYIAICHSEDPNLMTMIDKLVEVASNQVKQVLSMVADFRRPVGILLFAVLWQSVCSHLAICLQSFDSLFAVSWHSVCSLLAVCLQTHGSLFAVFWQSVCSLFAVFWQSVCSLLALCLQSFGSLFAFFGSLSAVSWQSDGSLLVVCWEFVGCLLGACRQSTGSLLAVRIQSVYFLLISNPGDQGVAKTAAHRVSNSHPFAASGSANHGAARSRTNLARTAGRYRF